MNRQYIDYLKSILHRPAWRGPGWGTKREAEASGKKLGWGVRLEWWAGVGGMGAAAARASHHSPSTWTQH